MCLCIAVVSCANDAVFLDNLGAIRPRCGGSETGHGRWLNVGVQQFRGLDGRQIQDIDSARFQAGSNVRPLAISNWQADASVQVKVRSGDGRLRRRNRPGCERQRTR